MYQELTNLIKELAEIFDAKSKDTYISLYINKKREAEKFINSREKTCNLVLKGEELKNFINTMNDIKRVLKKSSAQNIVIFASDKHHFMKSISLPIRVDNCLIVDSSPYLRPLARIQDEWEDFTILLISSNYAKIFSISLGEVEFTKNFSAEIMNKHKKGGWSQSRFNRLRKGAIHAFFREIEDALQKFADKHIIIAGPGLAKNQFKHMLPKNLKEKIVDVIDISFIDEKKLINDSLLLIKDRETSYSHTAVKNLKKEILRDGLAVYGINDTLDAVKNGQVELLIIEKDYKQRGWICEHCQYIDEGLKNKCPYCGKNTSEVDVLEEILEFAARTDATIEFTDDKEIGNLGHVGAILRYK